LGMGKQRRAMRGWRRASLGGRQRIAWSIAGVEQFLGLWVWQLVAARGTASTTATHARTMNRRGTPLTDFISAVTTTTITATMTAVTGRFAMEQVLQPPLLACVAGIFLVVAMIFGESRCALRTASEHGKRLENVES